MLGLIGLWQIDSIIACLDWLFIRNELWCSGDLTSKDFNYANIWLTNFTCWLFRCLVIVGYSSHELNSELEVGYSSHHSRNLSAKYLYNNDLLVCYSSHGLNTKLLVCYSSNLNNKPFNDQTHFDHLNTKIVHYSDPNSIC